jgi:hypothetical protein
MQPIECKKAREAEHAQGQCGWAAAMLGRVPTGAVLLA